MSDVVGSDLVDGFAPWDGRRVPVTLLGGYLGSGKTTVINELLAAADQPVAVLVNDIGEVNVDAALISRRHGDTIELTDGCVCCSLNHGLAEAFDQLRRRPEPPDHVVLELSGVADPGPVLPWTHSAGFRLDGVIVLVDADQFLDRLDDPTIGPMVRGQLAAADLFLLTKTDLASPARIESVTAAVRQLHPDTPIHRSADPMTAGGFLKLGTRHHDGFTAVPQPTLFDAHETTVIPMTDPTDLDRLEALLDQLDDRVMRAKAIVRDRHGSSHLVQVVGRRRTIIPLPEAEHQPPTDLVVISAKR